MNRRTDIPLLGGIAVALGFFVGLAVGADPDLAAHEYRGHIEGQLLGSLILLAIGVIDDRNALSRAREAAVPVRGGGRRDLLRLPHRSPDRPGSLDGLELPGAGWCGS